MDVRRSAGGAELDADEGGREAREARGEGLVGEAVRGGFEVDAVEEATDEGRRRVDAAGEGGTAGKRGAAEPTGRLGGRHPRVEAGRVEVREDGLDELGTGGVLNSVASPETVEPCGKTCESANLGETRTSCAPRPRPVPSPCLVVQRRRILACTRSTSSRRRCHRSCRPARQARCPPICRLQRRSGPQIAQSLRPHLPVLARRAGSRQPFEREVGRGGERDVLVVFERGVACSAGVEKAAGPSR